MNWLRDVEQRRLADERDHAEAIEARELALAQEFAPLTKEVGDMVAGLLEDVGQAYFGAGNYRVQEGGYFGHGNAFVDRITPTSWALIAGAVYWGVTYETAGRSFTEYGCLWNRHRHRRGPGFSISHGGGTHRSKSSVDWRTYYLRTEGLSRAEFETVLRRAVEHGPAVSSPE